MIRYFFLISILIVRTIGSHAQIEPRDTIPKQWLDGLIRSASDTNGLLSYEGKFILLDFWATYCSGCVASMPKMKSLQDRHLDKLRIFYVHPHDKKELSDFFSRWPELTVYKLPMIPITESIKTAFPFSTVPHLVLINPDGEVQAITKGGRDIVEKIDEWLKWGRIRMPYVPDFVNYSYQHPFFVNFPDMNVPLRSSATLLGRLESVRRTGPITQGGDGTGPFRLNIFNTNLEGLYGEIARRLFKFPHAEREIRVRGDKYFDSVRQTPEYYSYEYISSDSNIENKEALYHRIRLDLDLRFGFRSEIREMETDFYSLELPDSKLIPGDSSYSRWTLSNLTLVRQPMSVFAAVLHQTFKLPYPILQDSTKNFRGTLQLDMSQRNVESLESQIVQQGGKLVHKKRLIKVLYIVKAPE